MDALKGEQKGRKPEDLAHGGHGQNNCDHKLQIQTSGVNF